MNCAKLVDGRIVPYDVAGPKKDSYDPKNFTLIGRGVIDTVNGAKQPFDEIMYFFKNERAAERRLANESRNNL